MKKRSLIIAAGVAVALIVADARDEGRVVRVRDRRCRMTAGH